jgi:hypothetical protein
MQDKKLRLSRISISLCTLLALLSVSTTIQNSSAQDVIADDKAKRANDKETLSEDTQRLSKYNDALRQYEKQLANQEMLVKDAERKLALKKTKQQPDPNLNKLVRDEKAKVAVTNVYVNQYRDYVRRLQNRIAIDRSLIQQDSIDLAADDASRRLAQEQALQTSLDPYRNRYAPYLRPVTQSPMEDYGDSYTVPGYVTPYLGGGWGYRAPGQYSGPGASGSAGAGGHGGAEPVGGRGH